MDPWTKTSARAASLLCALALLGACDGPQRAELIYLDGRAVEPVGDSLLAFTAKGQDAFFLLDLVTDGVTEYGVGELRGPSHLQYIGRRWYVSDVVEATPSIVVFSESGEVERRIELDAVSSLPHQFGVLPNGMVVVQGRDSRLLALDGDSTETFAVTDIGSRPSLLAAADGGILHAVPDRHISLYNSLGNIRWRVDWPWRETAFVTDVSIDRLGRIHLIVSGEEPDTFIVFTIQRETGEVVRWSVPGPYATFVVNVFGEVTPDSTANWVGDGL